MHLRAARLLGVLLAPLLLLAAPTAAHAKGPEIFPLKDVKPGLKGYGLTVFSGTKPERFEFEVIGIARNFLPRVDIILVKSDDEKLKVSTFAQGMSGSPLYVDGKVMCAFSYSFRFSKTAIGGCTPIEYMLTDAGQPLRGPQATAMATPSEWEHVPMLDELFAGKKPERRAGDDSWLMASPLPTSTAYHGAVASSDGGGELQRAGIPLALSGLGDGAFDQARKLFAPYGIEPMRGAGGSGDLTGGPTSFEMGGSIGVAMAAGDVSAVGFGTVSYVDGPKISAFGHPMFGMGELYMPVTAAEVHAFVPSAMTAFKILSPFRVLGSLVMDRQTSITASTEKTTEMIPVDVTVKVGDKVMTWHSTVLRNRFLTPPLVALVVSGAAQHLVPDLADAVVSVDSKITIDGFDPLTFHDYSFSNEGASPNVVGGARGLRILAPLMFNPWTPVKLERIEVSVEVVYKTDYADIESIRLPGTEMPAGKPTFIEVTMRPYAGARYVERVPLTIPAEYAGTTLKLELTPGDSTRLDIAPPESLADLVGALRKTYPGDVLVATIYTPDEGVTLGGRVIPNLPDSAIDTARPGAGSRAGQPYKSLVRTIVPMKRVITGRGELVVKVSDKK